MIAGKTYRVNKFKGLAGIKNLGLLFVSEGRCLVQALRDYDYLPRRGDAVVFSGKGLVVVVGKRERLLLDEVRKEVAR